METSTFLTALSLLTKMETPAAFAIVGLGAAVAVPIIVSVVNRQLTKRARIEQEKHALSLGQKGTAVTLRENEYSGE